MDNSAFELHEGELKNSSPRAVLEKAQACHPDKMEKKKSWSLLKMFLLCLLAGIVTTTIGVLILSLVYVGHFSPTTGEGSGERDPAPSAGPAVGNKADSRFGFLNHLANTKVHDFQGGAIQWARFRKDPAHYDSDEEVRFGTSLNTQQSKMTAGTLRIKSKGMRAPHWHFNANEHGFLVQGSAWIGIVDDGGNTVTTYNVTAGQVIFFPKNTLHWVKNVGDGDCLFFLFFTTHDELQTLDVDDAFFSTPEDIAARSLKPQGGVNFIRTFKRPREDQAVNLPSNLGELIQNASYVQSPDEQVWKYFYDLKGSHKFLYPGGIIQWARYRKDGAGLNTNEKVFSESLNQHVDTLTLGTLRIYSNGLRQPHFHFNAHEMGYVISGCGKIGITGSQPTTDFEIGVGDVFFFPIGNQHYIKSTCVEDLYMILAFSTGNQLQTLDMDDYFQATADHILAQLFLKKQEEFKKIPKFKDDQAVNIP
ncbi:oxalate decarboxylase OxdC-like [Ambystoma mexicanum]|uniref:oxalate decarboxylase OxdC-like n=1 Tax=Ambystoma mexicanum TaxID=8296 RepID=UPI0037E7A296